MFLYIFHYRLYIKVNGECLENSNVQNVSGHGLVEIHGQTQLSNVKVSKWIKVLSNVTKVFSKVIDAVGKLIKVVSKVTNMVSKI